jgi:hypothetical protein
VAALVAPGLALASGQAGIGNAAAGPTPFITEIPVTLSGASLASVTFGVLSKPGSLVLPILSQYSAAYLSSHGYLSGSSLTVPVWGLYAGSNNTVALLFSFTDGSNAVAVEPVTTAAYVDPCGPVNTPQFTQKRTFFNNIGYNYFLLKDYCSRNAPSIVDTDGHLRWVGTAGVPGDTSLASTFFNNGVYVGDGGTGIDRVELTGQVSKIADFAPENVTFTGAHNIDPGRNGLVVEVNTTTETEGVALEFNATSGAVLNTWDMAKIITAAMTAGGDNPQDFVGPLGSDWFHMNSTTYNPADGTQIISSRENFVIDVDYDTPADGIKKIHWILGDTTKKWAQFPSLAKYALTPGANTFVPIGQHALSIDHSGNLMLFDDGNGSDYQVPAGLTRGYSAGRSYKIDTVARSATEVVNYTPQPHIFANFCGSFYEQTPNNYLIDFATAANDTQAILQGIGPGQNLVFQFSIAETAQTAGCGAGWNALPLANSPIVFQ